MHTLYHNAFNTKIKTKPFEQFSILMFDLEKEVSTKNQQKNLLDQILFGDQNSAQSWADYISYVMDIFPGQKMQIQRLINKGISCVDENKYRESKHLLKLHLNCASLKSNESESVRYFENVIWKKQIGIKFSMLYLNWAEVTRKVAGKAEAILVLQKGVHNHAEPVHSLLTSIDEFVQVEVACSSIEPPTESPTSSRSHSTTNQKKRKVSDNVSDGAIDDKTNRCFGQTECENEPDENLSCIDQMKGSLIKAEIPFAQASKVNIESKIEYIHVCRRDLIKLGVIGKGGSSTVYRLISPTTGALYAYKHIQIKELSSSGSICLNELEILNSLKESPFVIDLLDYNIHADGKQISLLMELGEIDLSNVLSQRIKSHTWPSGSATLMCPFFSRMVWKNMLEAVDYLHKNKIIHGDLKPANFVFVKNRLKLIDFGIATQICEDGYAYRDNQIGTINYMAPEAILPLEKGVFLSKGQTEMKIRVGPPSDIWSLGCILYQIIYGKPPFSHLTTIQKLQSIPNPSYQVMYDKVADDFAIESIKGCLVRDEHCRLTINGADGLLGMRYLVCSSSIHNREPLRPLSPLKCFKENIVTGKHEMRKSNNRKSLSSSLKIQIEDKPKLESNTHGDKWMKAKEEDIEKNDIRSVLEKRIGEMRKFLDEEDKSLDEFSESTM